MRLILAEPQNLVRAAFRHFFSALSDIEVVGEADSGVHLLEQIPSLQPDLVISEFQLRDINGFDLTQNIRRHYPAVGLMFLSATADTGHVRAALRFGACGFLSKSSEPQEIELAMNAYRKGQIYVSASLSHKLLQGRKAERGESSGVLTRRQREVLRLVGRGKSTKEIAILMGLSPKTVETHRARLMQVLGLRGINALTHFAIRNGQQQTD